LRKKPILSLQKQICAIVELSGAARDFGANGVGALNNLVALEIVREVWLTPTA
jgi:hypothetical protein